MLRKCLKKMITIEAFQFLVDNLKQKYRGIE